RICNLRYLSRDAGVGFRDYAGDVLAEKSDSNVPAPPGPGVAAWNDFNPVADYAREALRRAAGIDVPDRGFVVWVVGGYLLVLVPANWFLFRLVGRVEWAWAAAPLIAVVCTVVVIRAARLNIGFARSRTEIAVMELQADYPRAHLTRYIALYTSLTTGYEFHFEHPGALVQPLPSRAGPEGRVRNQSRHRLLYRHGDKTILEGFSVISNSTGMVHSEEMIDLGGALSLVGNPEG
ncbi:unnamed protein product, partial [marine sediment metagenome]